LSDASSVVGVCSELLITSDTPREGMCRVDGFHAWADTRCLRK
jgi:hypothetical protein